jgi:hypothetical protein
VKLTIVEQRCTKCGSEDVRSKVSTEDGCSFRCDSCGADFFVPMAELKVLGTAELPEAPIITTPSQMGWEEKENDSDANPVH